MQMHSSAMKTNVYAHGVQSFLWFAGMLRRLTDRVTDRLSEGRPRGADLTTASTCVHFEHKLNFNFFFAFFKLREGMAP